MLKPDETKMKKTETKWIRTGTVFTPAQRMHSDILITPAKWSHRVQVIAPAKWNHRSTVLAVLIVFLMISVINSVLNRQPAVAAPGITQVSSGPDEINTGPDAANTGPDTTNTVMNKTNTGTGEANIGPDAVNTDTYVAYNGPDEANRGISTEEVDAEVLLAGLDNLRDMRVSTHGNVFLVESGRNRLLKTSGNGERLDSLGRLGSGDYQFDMPVAVDPTNELKIYVADRNNRRIQVFDRRFQYLSTVRLPRRSDIASEYRPTLLEVDSYGRLYFFDEDRHLMYRFDSHGRYELAFELFSEEERIRPGSMAILDEVLWIADMRGQLLHRFSTRGSYLGFIYAPEPVRALRVFGDRIWGLGARHLMQLDSSGDIRFSLPLPDLSVSGDTGDAVDTGGANDTANANDTGNAGNRPVISDLPRWHRFDIHDNRIFLVSESMLFRWQFTRPVRELTE